MLTANGLGIFFALTSAFVWGSADFSGGLATRKIHQYQVLVLSSLSGLVLLIAGAIWLREPFPSLTSMLWAAIAGISGALGIAALYRALSLGNTASVAPTAAVIGAALPVFFNMVTGGLPKIPQLTGFILAFVGIWLVAQPSPAGGNGAQQGLGLAFLAGIGFGGFFIMIAQVQPGIIFTPLIVARSVSFCLALLLMTMRRLPLPSLNSNPFALLAGVLDAGGNIFFLLANQFTRLDVVAVLSAFYPITTVILAYLVLKENVSRPQWIGASLCITAVALITI